jgi:hypothetical protein
MLLLDSVVPEKWYRVHEVAAILGWAHDTIERWIDDGLLQAFVIELRSSKIKRSFRGKRVQGCEIIRFVNEHLTPLKTGKAPRFRVA